MFVDGSMAQINSDSKFTFFLLILDEKETSAATSVLFVEKGTIETTPVVAVTVLVVAKRSRFATTDAFNDVLLFCVALNEFFCLLLGGTIRSR